VDVETGAVRLLNYWVPHDRGTLMSRMLVEGQIVGGMVHGIGNALFEQMKHDRESGQRLTTNFGEYLLPLATEMPPIHCDHMETPSPRVKGPGKAARSLGSRASCGRCGMR
jgi:carbon-monoxide dehydrogenase large subunit